MNYLYALANLCASEAGASEKAMVLELESSYHACKVVWPHLSAEDHLPTAMLVVVVWMARREAMRAWGNA